MSDRDATVIEIANEAETVALGVRLAHQLTPPTIVSLVGPLGAGKTRLVRAIADELGVTEDVTSPTFVVVNEYTTGRVPVYHFDAYRLADEDEFEALGAEEYLAGQAAAGPGLSLIEWGDRVAGSLPPDTIELRIEPVGGERRRVTLHGLRLGNEAD